MACESIPDLAHETFANATQESWISEDDARRVVYPLMNLLLKGEPVPPGKLADHSGLPLDRVESVLQEWKVERNESGEITGGGLTLNPTSHEYQVGEQTLYTWCAPDALLFPKVLDHTAGVVSSDPVTGEKITMTVSPEGVDDLAPSTTVVSWTHEADGRDIRETFCRYGRFFACPQTAKQWQRDHPQTEILEVEEALEAVRLMDSFL